MYRDATDAASLRQELRVLSTRALRQYIAARGGDQGRPERPPGHADLPRPLHRQDAAGQRALVRDRPRARRDAEGERVVHPARARGGRQDAGADSSLDIVTPDFDIPDVQNSIGASGTPFTRRGYVDGMGVVSRPIGVGEQAEPRTPFSKPGRYYLKLALEDSSDKALYNATGGQPYRRRARDRGARAQGRGKAGRRSPSDRRHRSRSTRPNEPPSAAVLTLRRRRAGRGGLRGAGVLDLPAAAAAVRRLLVIAARRARAARAAPHAQERQAGRRRRLVQHRAAARAGQLRRYGRGRRDRVLEGQAGQGTGAQGARRPSTSPRSRPNYSADRLPAGPLSPRLPHGHLHAAARAAQPTSSARATRRPRVARGRRRRRSEDRRGRRARACSASSRSWPATTTSSSSRRPGEWYIGLSVADSGQLPAEQPVELPVELDDHRRGHG